MPTFPDGSRAWIIVDGNALTEYQEVVERDEALNTLTITVYVASQKGKEFSVGHHITKPFDAEARMCSVYFDGVLAQTYQANDKHYCLDLKSEGWELTPTTLRKYVFGEIDISQDVVAGSSSDMKKQIMRACITLDLCDAVLGAPSQHLGSQVRVAEAVHPDSKVASLVGCQVQAAPPITLSVPRNFATRSISRKPGAIRYIAKFLYRPERILIAQDIMPDPDPKPQADKDNGNKRKRGSSAEQEAGAAAGGAETAHERMKRLAAELRAVKQELGVGGSQDVVDVDAPPKPKVFIDLETGKEIVKKESGESNSEAIDVDAGPKNEKIYIDLSDDED